VGGDEMITQAAFMGRGTKFGTGSNVTLKKGSDRVQDIVPTTPIDVDLPDARDFKVGGPIFYIFNHAAAAYNISVEDYDGGSVVVLSQDDSCILLLLDNSTAAGVWTYIKYPKFAPI
jgi:hypothetical protein